jgi:hypothetical protein
MIGVKRLYPAIFVILLAPLAGPVRAQCPQMVTNTTSFAAIHIVGPAPLSCDLPHNDLLPESIKPAHLINAQPFLDAFSAHPMSNQTLQQVMVQQGWPDLVGVDPAVGKLLSKVVSCALDYGHKLTPVGGAPLEGELGLCPDWAQRAPSPSTLCRQIVSSCVLARVNALGARIVLSLRAKDRWFNVPPLDVQSLIVQSPVTVPSFNHYRIAVPVETQYREGGGVEIPIFKPCGSGPRTNCDFEPLYVGRCTADQQVYLAAASPEMKVRVCKGLYGCEIGAPPLAHPYASFLAEGVGLVGFKCPANGPRSSYGGRWGYYSVMSSRPSVQTEQVWVKAISSGRGNYPANELEVYTYPEGAFYGNLFRPEPLDKSSSKVLNGAEYACYGNGWASGVAQMNERFCASPTAPNCFANPPVACFESRDHVCATDALGGDAFSKCRYATATDPWQVSLTTYLNNPCDLTEGQCDPTRLFPHHVVKGRTPAK